MNELRILSEEANDILIAGHIRPDGDCVCMYSGISLSA